MLHHSHIYDLEKIFILEDYYRRLFEIHRKIFDT